MLSKPWHNRVGRGVGIIAISRGFFLPDGTKRFKKSLAIPDDKKIADFLAKKLKEFCAGTSSASQAREEAPAEAPAEEEPAEEPAEETTEEAEENKEE